MSLTKQAVIDQITVTENGVIYYREATRIMEDGNQISQTYHRSSLTPAQDLTGVPANVVAICQATLGLLKSLRPTKRCRKRTGYPRASND
jgi:hypothetical protein